MLLNSLKSFSLGSLIMLGAVPGLAGGEVGESVMIGQDVPVVQPERRPVDLVLCLDTSGSMRGLIDAARQKLWAIANDLALAEPAPDLRVALLSYGNDGYQREAGWVRLDTPFTTDLDLVSEKLFDLTINGGTEYVGRVLEASMARLDWSDSADALQLVVVSGNESADQDPVSPFRTVCRNLISRGIMVNAIYCGSPEDGVAYSWREVAEQADGYFACIDQDRGTVVITTPFDGPMAELSVSLNVTYIPYGEFGLRGCASQTAQDGNAASLNSAAAASRAQAKGSGNYRNSHWDLVDACREKAITLDDIEASDLPEDMRIMTQAERRAHVEEMQKKRDSIQGQIRDLEKQRQAYILVEMKKQNLDEDQSFDAVIRRAIRKQAMEKGFVFPSPPQRLEENKNASQVADGC